MEAAVLCVSEVHLKWAAILATYVTHSDKRLQSRREGHQITGANITSGSLYQFIVFGFFHNVGRIFCHILTTHIPVWPIHDFKTWLAVHKGVQTFEKRRLQDLDQKRHAHKERRPDPTSTVACPQCGRICASNFGLRCHLRRHWRLRRSRRTYPWWWWHPSMTNTWL